MLIFATSDKGGTGRSVTSANVVYRRSLLGSDVAYLDFDFGSPTSGTIFQIDRALRGANGGTHSYLQGDVPEPVRFDVWSTSDRASLRTRPDGSGSLYLYPGDESGGEFARSDDIVVRAAELLLRLDEEMDLTVVDLSAGRSHATDIALAATARPEMRRVPARWLIFHRWTRQHILAASGLAWGQRGIVDIGVQCGHDRNELTRSIRFVRTAVVDPDADQLAGLLAPQVAWLRECNQELLRLAGERGVGRTKLLGSIPLDPVLQWREQLITDYDVISRKIANRATVDAFERIATQLDDDRAWVGL
jgi:hypothetical protein